MKKNPKDQKTQKTIQAKPLKEIVPSSYPHIREPSPIQEPTEPHSEYTPQATPSEIFEEWPNETDISVLQAQLLPNTSSTDEAEQTHVEVFKDPNNSKILLPYSLTHDFITDEVKWVRPEVYVKENHLDVEIIKTLPNKNHIKFRLKVQEMYEKDKEIEKKKAEGEYYHEDNSGGSDDSLGFENRDKFAFYRDYFKIIDQPIEMKIVSYLTREETEDEMEERIKRENDEYERKIKENPKMKKQLQQEKAKKDQQPKEKLIVNEPNPSNISMKDEYPLYFKWLASIFQIIKDRNIVDCNTKETIWQKIYPQQNGAPVYNPTGRYWVKLYHFGKARKIEIDDTMPLSKYNLYYLPKCEHLEELWPALLTKAILKLNSYKLPSFNFSECSDLSVFYALTGYIPEVIEIDQDIYHMFDGDEEERIRVEQEIEEQRQAEEEEKERLRKEEEEKTKTNVDEDNNNNNNKHKDGNESDNSHSSTESKPKKKEASLPDMKVVEQIKNEIHINDNHNASQDILETNIDKLKFLSLALNDNNYNNKQCFLFCYRKVDEHLPEREAEEERKAKAASQKIYKTELQSQRSGTIKTLVKPPVRKQLRRLNSIAIRSPKTLLQMKALQGMVNDPSSFGKLRGALGSNSKEAPIQNAKTKVSSSILDFQEDKIPDKPIKRPKEQLYEDKIYMGLLYDVIECFDNHKFNMNRLLPIDFSDLKAIVKTLNTTYVFKQLPKEEKLIYIQKLKAIKYIQRQEKAKRIECLKLNGNVFNYIKIGNNSLPSPIEFKIPHTNEELEMTKKCLLNKWSFPPMEFLEKRYQDQKALEPKNEQDKNEESDDDMIEEKKKKEHTWSKETYLTLINRDLDQYKEENTHTPLIRESGTWVEPNEFFNIFDSFIMLYNPSLYKYNFDWDNLWYDTSDSLNVNDNNKVIRLHPNEHTVKSYIVVNFVPNSDNAKKLKDIYYSIHFTLFTKGKEDKREIVLNSLYQSKHISGLELDKEHYLMFNGGVFPTGFYVKLLSDFEIQPMNYSEYLENFNEYKNNTFYIEHNALIENEPYMLMKAKVVVNNKSKFLIVSESKMKHVLDFTDVYVCNDATKTKIKVSFDSIFYLTQGEYVICVIVSPPFSFNEEPYNIHILHSECQTLKQSESVSRVGGDAEHQSDQISEVQSHKESVNQDNEQQEQQQQLPAVVVEQLDMIPAYEINDFYIPNKHFILFQEFIFSGDIVHASFVIRLRRLLPKQTDDEEELQKAKQATKGKATQNEPKYEEFPLKDKLRIKLELYDRNGEIMLQKDFYNSIIIHNVVLEGNTIADGGKKDVKKDPKKQTVESSSKDSNLPYTLKCYFDETELPKTFNTEEYLKGLNWLIRVFSTDTLGFAKDTSKEDRERALIESWEKNEPGRAEKAQRSRRRFLLEQQKLKGNELTEEDLQFLAEPRERKRFNKEEEKVDDKKDNKKNGNKRDANMKKTIKNNGVDDGNDDGKKEELNFNKVTSVESKHSSLYIKNFLHYVYDNRKIERCTGIEPTLQTYVPTEETKETKP